MRGNTPIRNLYRQRSVEAACMLLAVAAIGLVFVTHGVLNAQKAKTDKPKSEAELKKAYAETEKLVSKASTNDRPGLAPWNQKQGEGLEWPAKYYLPWPAGVSHEVYQSWDGNKIGPPRATHMQPQNYYAWDFHIVRGQYICAARDGTVKLVTDDKPAGQEVDNVIYIDHADGETSVYAHVGSGTALVARGDKVLAGQKICEGSSESLHLHFVIWKSLIDYPCRFIDYDADNSVPQYGASPTSGNKGPDDAVINEIKTNYQKGETAYKAKDYLTALKFYLAATQTEVRIEEYESALERIEECRKIIDDAVAEAVKNAKDGDFKGAEKRLKEIKKTYGDYAKRRIDKALEELKDDPKFKDWVAKERADKLLMQAAEAERMEDWDKAEKLYREIKRLFKRGDPEYEQARKKLGKIKLARALED